MRRVAERTTKINTGPVDLQTHREIVHFPSSLHMRNPTRVRNLNPNVWHVVVHGSHTHSAGPTCNDGNLACARSGFPSCCSGVCVLRTTAPSIASPPGSRPSRRCLASASPGLPKAVAGRFFAAATTYSVPLAPSAAAVAPAAAAARPPHAVVSLAGQLLPASSAESAGRCCL